MSIKTYSEMMSLNTFEERYKYLQLQGKIGEETFGYDRWLNQNFYSTKDWKDFRRSIILRDMGCDLGIEDREIQGLILIHHINPITIKDITNRNIDVLLNPENVICTSKNTHNAIHYGDSNLLITTPIERSKNDTCPWRQK